MISSDGRRLLEAAGCCHHSVRGDRHPNLPFTEDMPVTSADFPHPRSMGAAKQQLLGCRFGQRLPLGAASKPQQAPVSAGSGPAIEVVHAPNHDHPLKRRNCYLPLGKPQKRAISVAAQTSVATTELPTCPHDEAASVRIGKAWARPSTNTLSTRTAPLPSTKSSRRIGP